MPSVPTEQLSRRRQETRSRLLDAAFRVFAAEGFGRATVERICEAADYTRGAFYSNFSSLDELFLAMWQERTVRMVADLQAALDRPVGAESADELLAEVLAAVPRDADWYRISLEFTAHALRNPGLRRAVAAREAAIAEALFPSLEAALDRAGRRVTDRTALGQALIAVHDGTLAQCLLEPDDPAVWQRRDQLFRNVLFSYTEERPR